MENKYYTPDITEFHIGFEYERKDYDLDDLKEKWYKRVFPEDGLCDGTIEKPDLVELSYSMYDVEGEIRVKYLDKEDIEDCNWRYYGSSTTEGMMYMETFLYGKESRKYALNIDWVNSQEGLMISINIHNSNCNSCLCNNSNIIFIGKIKNKSELKRLIKQLNIS